jgi:hypothetical protein
MSSRSSHNDAGNSSPLGLNTDVPPVNGAAPPPAASTAPHPSSGPIIGSSQSSDDEFDITRYRVDQDCNLHIAAQKKAVVVAVSRPDKQSWVLLHPSEAWRMAAFVLEDKANRRVFLVEPNIAPDVMSDLTLKLLVAYVSRSGACGLWAIRLPDESGRIDTFNESALEIVAEHSNKWIRILCDQQERAYSILDSPPLECPIPKWPEGGFLWMLRTAFKNRIVKSLDHPVLQALRGKVSRDSE